MKSIRVPENIKVGTILYESWGYDQTNIDFYQVVRVSDKSVWFSPIKSNTVETGFMCGHTTAIKDAFTSVRIERRLVKSYGPEDNPRICIPYDRHSLDVWDGRELHCSWYA